MESVERVPVVIAAELEDLARRVEAVSRLACRARFGARRPRRPLGPAVLLALAAWGPGSSGARGPGTPGLGPARLVAQEPGRLTPGTPGIGGIPFVDLASESERHVVVDREPGQYLGHPTTVLLPDGRTILAVYPKGHGAGAIVMRRSDDGGRTWSERLPVPGSWASSQEVPTIFRVTKPDGGERLLLFSGLYPIRLSVSEDEGASWSELAPIGAFGGIVAMASLARRADGSLMALFHDDGRFLRGSGERREFRVYRTLSLDGGLTWDEPEVVAARSDVDLCEPGLVRSPDGSRIALLLRENRRVRNSFVVFSDDDGRTWSEPRELPASLTGDRHVAAYGPDGRLVVTFRDMAEGSPTRGDPVVWVGTWEDLVAGESGLLRARVLDNVDAWDSAYSGLELLPDGTFVLTTYGHWEEEAEPWVVSTRFRVDELLARAPTR